jgi:hypothetical protein
VRHERITPVKGEGGVIGSMVQMQESESQRGGVEEDRQRREQSHRHETAGDGGAVDEDEE